MTFRISEVLILSFIFYEYCSQFCVKMLIYYSFKILRDYPTSEAMHIFHLYVAFFHLSVVLVNVIANTRLGDYWTIFILSVISISAYSTICIQDVSYPESFQWYSRFAMLLIVAITTGGNFTCVKYICISQYKFPHEAHRYKKMMFVMILFRCLGEFYGSVTISMFSELVDPESLINSRMFVLSHKIIGTIFIVSGYNVFLKRRSRRNYIADFVMGSYYALKRKLTHDKKEVKDGHFTQSDIQKIKMLYYVLPLYIPVACILPYKEQKFTKFVYQSEAMSNKLGSINLIPLVMLSFNPAFVIFGVAIFHSAVIPLTIKYKYNFATSQLRAIVAFCFLALSYAAGSILESHVEKYRAPIMEPGKGILALLNTLPCSINIKIEGMQHIAYSIEPLSFSHSFQQYVDTIINRDLTVDTICFEENIEGNFVITISDTKVSVALIHLGELILGGLMQLKPESF